MNSQSDRIASAFSDNFITPAAAIPCFASSRVRPYSNDRAGAGVLPPTEN